jgi:phosphate transport system permease protein
MNRSGAETLFRAVCLVALSIPLAMLLVLLLHTFSAAYPRISWEFITGYPSRRPALAGLLPALAGSFYLMILTGLMALPIGVAAALYLEEYATPSTLTRIIEVNINNLAGVPSIIYGLLGLELFVRAMSLERSLVAGAATLALLVLPVVIITSREALRSVPFSYREAALALGAEKWRTLLRVVLPMSLPGILTGLILAMARAIGETAPLITIGALTYIAFLPDSLQSPFTALPLQIFNWVSRPQAEFQVNAAAGIMVLVVLLMALNGLAIWLRARLQRRIYW